MRPRLGGKISRKQQFLPRVFIGLRSWPLINDLMVCILYPISSVTKKTSLLIRLQTCAVQKQEFPQDAPVGVLRWFTKCFGAGLEANSIVSVKKNLHQYSPNHRKGTGLNACPARTNKQPLSKPTCRTQAPDTPWWVASRRHSVEQRGRAGAG